MDLCRSKKSDYYEGFVAHYTIGMLRKLIIVFKQCSRAQLMMMQIIVVKLVCR